MTKSIIMIVGALLMVGLSTLSMYYALGGWAACLVGAVWSGLISYSAKEVIEEGNK